MKITTSELTGAALDWAVAKSKQMKQEGFWLLDDQNNGYLLNPHFDGMSRLWSPSTLWAQGGPIIEREICEIIKGGEPTYWEARAGFDGEPGHAVATGPTPLIAAMRCYVASKLGGDVEVPNGLL